MLPDTHHRGDDEWKLGVHAEAAGSGVLVQKLPEPVNEERDGVG